LENTTARWYVVRTFSGHENKVKGLIDAELRDNVELKARIFDVLVPTEKVFEVKDGKKKTKKKNFFPGYVLLCADLDVKVKDFIRILLRLWGSSALRTIRTLCSPMKLKELSDALPRMTMSKEPKQSSEQAILLKLLMARSTISQG